MHKREIHTTTQYRAETMYNYFSNINKSKLNLVNHMTHKNYEITHTLLPVSRTQENNILINSPINNQKSIIKLD